MAWGVFHAKGSYTGSMLYLTETAAAAGDTNVYTTTTQTNTVFTVGDWPGINQNTTDYISYCWHDVPGLQKFGSYKGNSANSGTFVDCGFEPALIIIRVVNDTNSWYLHDIARTPSNPSNNYLNPNLDAAQTVSSHPIDFLSNGFKLRNGTYDGYNVNYTYI